ncbi:hypothetical protein DSC45_31045 [Streptomyces sp. YIM 130001]|uniref:DUF5134 domain-containing protein n=1 Tax=Streptomyces sp. YIM 130001 TaxID=2259644 RepID=UPI000EEB036D|nr:DUF5134 domain-containing protein [Streptomyces sp. YIM 130001]RII09313.1 hypothetical protein DSC45_31045 [Streptomyces sp. YIM 130001]
MHGPAAAGWLLVALCAATGAYCLLRMRSTVDEQRAAAGSEALMGFGMALMAVPAAVFGPPRWVWGTVAVVFGATAVRSLWSARSSAHHLHHLVGALAMVYMAVVMAAPASAHAAHGGHSGGGAPVLTALLLVYYGGYVLVAGFRLVPVPAVGAGGPGGSGWGDRPELAMACRLSMGIGMLAMLLIM